MADLKALIRKKRKEIQDSTGHQRAEKPAPGKSRYRILPSWLGAGELFFHEYGQHWIKRKDPAGGNDKVLAVAVCKSDTHGDRCEICEAIQNAKFTATDDEMVELLTQGQSKGTFLFNALNLGGDDKTTPIVLQLTKTTADQIFSIFDEHGEDMLDLEKGIDVVIERKGVGFDTKYNVQPAAKSKPVDKGVLKRLNNLDDFVKETEDGYTKALTAVAVISGSPALLDAVGGSSTALEDHSGSKKATAASTIIELDDAEVTDVTDFDVAGGDDEEVPFEVDEVEEKKASPSTADFNTEIGNDDLESMLADLA